VVLLAASSRATWSALSCQPQGTEVLLQLRRITRTDQHAGHRGPLQQPVDGDLRRRLAGLGRHLVHRVDHAVQALVVDRWREAGGLVQAAASGQGLAAAHLAGQAAPTERAPHDGAQALVLPQRHQLPFVVAADQRVVALVGHVALQAESVGGGERFHQLPAGEVGHAEVPHLAGAHQVVQRGQHLLNWRHRIEGVQLQDVDVVSLQTLQRRVGRFDQVVAR